MKKLEFLRWAALASVAWLVSSCATVGPQESTAVARPRFREGATADMVLRFFKWDAIYMTKPDTRENGFLPLLGRDDLPREVKNRNVSRNTAVVVVSLFYRDPDQLAQLSHEWTAYLNEQGFRRVVVLHAGPGNEVDGLPILSDSTITSITDVRHEPAKVAATRAAVPAAAGADVANSSGVASR